MEESTDELPLVALKVMWKSKIPFKIKIFGWRIMINRLAMKDQLMERNIICNDADKVCIFCNSMEEDRGHLFFCVSCQGIFGETYLCG